MVTTKALQVWLAAVVVYVAAITGRTSFGVAGVAAMERFEVDAAAIAVFASVQVGTYALMQIPTGVAIDRFGPRAMLVIGALVMGIGQVILGLSSSYPIAVAARVLIGAGDATAFLSVMRILPYWFPLPKAPMFTQMTSSVGQIGQFLSAVPFAALLGATGWTVSFVSLGAVGVIIALAAAVAVSDSPEAAGIRSTDTTATVSPAADRLPGTRSGIGVAVRSPVAWQAFFTHYIGLILVPVFILMWGVPLMTQAMGLSPAQAGIVLTVNTVFLVIFSPLHGRVSARLSHYRHITAIGFALAHMLSWLIFFLPTQPRGFGAMLVMAAVMAAFFPAANYGFDVIRENMHRSVVATATGLGNMGGFFAGMIGAQLVGIVLSVRSGGNSFYWTDFRVAALWLALLWFIGIIGVVLTYLMRRRGGDSGPRVTVHTLPE